MVDSRPFMGHGGVIQYDFGETTPDRFVPTGFLSQPPVLLLNVASKMRANHDIGINKLSDHLSRFHAQLAIMKAL